MMEYEDVLALVSTYDPAVEAHRTNSPDNWWASNLTADYYETDPSYPLTYNESFLWMRYAPPRDFSPRAAATFLSIHDTNLLRAEAAYLFATTRRECFGRWNITQTTATLMNSSSCADTITTHGLLQDTSHLILTNFSGLALVNFYPPILAEILAPFITRRNSQWFKTTMATAVASMYWTRIAAAIGPSGPHCEKDDSFINDPVGNFDRVRNATLSYTSSPDIS